MLFFGNEFLQAYVELIDVMLKECFEQCHLGGKVVEQPAFAQPRFGGNGIKRQADQAITLQNAATGRKDQVTCFYRRAAPTTKLFFAHAVSELLWVKDYLFLYLPRGGSQPVGR
jgi:hypothetical protein